MFRAFCLKYLLAERYTVGLIERLHSSPRFREICGFGDAVPSDATFSRFFRLLADIDGFADCAMAEMVENLRERLPDVGERVAVDSTDIEAYANPNRSEPNDPDAYIRAIALIGVFVLTMATSLGTLILFMRYIRR